MTIYAWTAVILAILVSPLLILVVLVRSAPLWDEDFQAIKDDTDEEQSR